MLFRSTSISQTLALDIHRHINSLTEPQNSSPHVVWSHVLHLLARVEHDGTDPAAALAEAVRAPSPGQDRAGLESIAAHLRTITQRAIDPRLPAWLRPPRTVADPEWQQYLAARAELIRDRTDTLAESVAQHRPAWTRYLGQTPTDPIDRADWLHHLAVLAAYRDQFQITDDDPDHPLGPYPERGRVGHRAYWIAAASLLALHGTRTDTDPSWGRLATDRYRTLTKDEQARIATELADRLGPDWLGNVRNPAADADQPVYQDHLAAVLVEHGHLSEPGAGPADGQTGRASHAPSRAKLRQDRQGRAAQPRQQPAPGARRAPAPLRPTTPIQRPPQAPPEQPRGPRPGR